MTSPDVVDVVVIGAGFAGLAAATSLAENGARVLVADARPQLGGRATAFQDRETGELVDNGQHVMFGCYRETLALLERVGAMGNVDRQASLAVPYLDDAGRRSELRCPSWPPPLHLLGAVIGWSALPLGDRLSVLRMGLPLAKARRELARSGDVSQGVDTTVSGWLRARGQGPTLTSWLWEPLAVAALNQAPDEALAQPFVRVLAEMFGPDREAAAMVLPNRPLHQMYAEPARAYIEQRGGEVRTSALARVVADEGGVRGVEIRGSRADETRTITAGAIVSAVPWFALRSLFSTAVPASLSHIVEQASRMEAKPIVTVNLWYDRQVMQEPFVGLPGRAMQWVFDKRLAFGESASHLSLVSSGADMLVGESSEALIARAAREVAGAMPEARAATLLRGTVIREKRATFSLAAGQPSRPGAETPLRGLVLAGDWTDTGLPGTIESAVVSGHRAAAVIRRTQGGV